MPARSTRTGSGSVLLMMDDMKWVTSCGLTLYICDQALVEIPVVPVAWVDALRILVSITGSISIIGIGLLLGIGSGIKSIGSSGNCRGMMVLCSWSVVGFILVTVGSSTSLMWPVSNARRVSSR